jgi:hypothetical protein
MRTAPLQQEIDGADHWPGPKDVITVLKTPEGEEVNIPALELVERFAGQHNDHWCSIIVKGEVVGPFEHNEEQGISVDVFKTGTVLLGLGHRTGITLNAHLTEAGALGLAELLIASIREARAIRNEAGLPQPERVA